MDATQCEAAGKRSQLLRFYAYYPEDGGRGSRGTSASSANLT